MNAQTEAATHREEAARVVNRIIERRRRWRAVRGTIVASVVYTALFGLIGWAVMIAVGNVHAWWPAVPTAGADDAAALTFSGTLVWAATRLYATVRRDIRAAGQRQRGSTGEPA